MLGATLLRLLDGHVKRWRREITACREDLPRGAVHRLRVSSRRLLSFIQLAGALTELPRTAQRQASTALDALLDDLGPLRDAQNQRHRVKRTRSGPGIDTLDRHLKRRVKRRARRARHTLDTVTGKRLDRALDRIREALAAPGASIAAGERRLRLAKAVDVTAAGVRKRLARLDSAKPRSTHRLRIALRRFRYAVETASRLAPAYGAGLATLRALQERLGRAHDAQALLQRLERFERWHPGETGAGVEALRRTIDRERIRAVTSFPRLLTPLRRLLAELPARAATRR